MIHICIAGPIVNVDNSDVSVGFSNTVLKAIELVDVCLLEPIPQEVGGDGISPRKAA